MPPNNPTSHDENKLNEDYFLSPAHQVKTTQIIIDEEDGSDWLLSFADMITLLLIFFVLMFSFTKVDQQHYEEARKAIKAGLNKSLASHKSQERQTEPKLHQMLNVLTELIKKSGLSSHISLVKGQSSISVELKSHGFFEPGKAEILPEMKQNLGKVIAVINTLDINNYTIEIEGHTDSTPIHTLEFNSNWELSAKRALNVLHFFLENNIPQSNLRAIAYGSTKPKAKPTGNESEVVLDAMHQQNRRVVIHIKPLKK